MMYRKIKGEYKVEKVDNSIFIRNLNIPGLNHEITKYVAIVLLLFNGRRSDYEIDRIIDALAQKNHKWKELYDDTIRNYGYILEEYENENATGPYELEAIKEVLLLEQNSFILNRRMVPRKIIWLITDLCSRQCIYCYLGKEKTKQINVNIGDITTERIQKLANECLDIGVEEVVLSGGDPLLCKNVYDIISQFQKKKISIYIFTKMIIDFSKLKYKEYLMFIFSLDSIVPETADYLAGYKGHCGEMLENIRLCEESNISFSVSITVCSMNILEIEDTVNWLLNNTTGSVAITKYKCYKGRNDIGEVTDGQFEKLHEEIVKMVKADYSNRLIFNMTMDSNDICCDAGRERIVIDKFGNAKICEKSLESIDGCNVFEKGLLSVWNSPQYIEGVGSLQNRNWKCPFKE